MQLPFSVVMCVPFVHWYMRHHVFMMSDSIVIGNLTTKPTRKLRIACEITSSTIFYEIKKEEENNT